MSYSYYIFFVKLSLIPPPPQKKKTSASPSALFFGAIKIYVKFQSYPIRLWLTLGITAKIIYQLCTSLTKIYAQLIVASSTLT